MTPVTANAPKPSKTKKPPDPAVALPGGYAGKLLRVDLTTRKCWAEPWGSRMRELLGGAGLGAMLLYRETAKRGGKGNVAWDDPDNRLVLPPGPPPGPPRGGPGRPPGRPDRA